MSVVSETRFARSGDAHIAYSVTGEGPFELAFVPDGIIPIASMEEEPHFERFLRRLESFSRLIRFDRRGIGLSDPVTPSSPPTLEQWADDLRAVLDAAVCQRAALLGMAEGGLLMTLFAATYPERTSALVLVNATPAILLDPGKGLATQVVEGLVSEGMQGDWVAQLPESVPVFAPSMATNQRYIDWLARALRQAASPATMQAIFDTLFRSDIRPILPAVRVPTLIVHRASNRYVSAEHGRLLAARIPGAKYVEVPGSDHVPYIGDAEAILGEVEEFLTGVRRSPKATTTLATLLFLDVVGSTEQIATLGNRRWVELLDGYRELARREIDRFDGREIDTAGDGFLAAFDGPARAIHCAQSIVAAVPSLDLEVRVGLHTGECEVVASGLAGLAVHIASRVMAMARPQEVLVTSTVRDLVVGSRIQFQDRGLHTLKGVPDQWRLFAAGPSEQF
jgi:pimeloyl-ACP methyl ester carboxylesterase